MRGSSQALSYQNRVSYQNREMCAKRMLPVECLRDTVSCQVRHMHDVRPQRCADAEMCSVRSPGR
eukprot:2177901-Prymnesium_polylepis.1